MSVHSNELMWNMTTGELVPQRYTKNGECELFLASFDRIGDGARHEFGMHAIRCCEHAASKLLVEESRFAGNFLNQSGPRNSLCIIHRLHLEGAVQHATEKLEHVPTARVREDAINAIERQMRPSTHLQAGGFLGLLNKLRIDGETELAHGLHILYQPYSAEYDDLDLVEDRTRSQKPWTAGFVCVDHDIGVSSDSPLPV